MQDLSKFKLDNIKSYSMISVGVKESEENQMKRERKDKLTSERSVNKSLLFSGELSEYTSPEPYTLVRLGEDNNLSSISFVNEEKSNGIERNIPINYFGDIGPFYVLVNTDLLLEILYLRICLMIICISYQRKHEKFILQEICLV